MPVINSFLEPVQTWFLQRRHSLVAWLSTDQQDITEPEDALLQLPSSLRHELFRRLQQLPSHPNYTKQLETEFQPAVERWYKDNTKENQTNDWDIGYQGNLWIVVGSSVTDLQAVLNVFLKKIADPNSSSEEGATYQGLNIRLVNCEARPDIRSIKHSLQQQLEHKHDSSHKRELVIIPCLEHYFLRSVDGLDSIDYLRKHLLNDPSRFWILGLGQVGWQYLQSIFTLDAYSEHVTHLAELTDQQLSEWIDPVVSELNIEFPTSSLQSKLSRENLSHKEKYFKSLEKASDGIDTVAVQLFLNTLQVVDEAEENFQQNQSSPQDSELSDPFQNYQLRVKSPQRPSLPQSSDDDVYLLYSLLLHRTLTREELAESLGLNPEQIDRPVQVLRKAGVIERQAKTLRLSPDYYPTVCTKLAGDNFAI